MIDDIRWNPSRPDGNFSVINIEFQICFHYHCFCLCHFKHNVIWWNPNNIWVRSWRCSCLVTWFCYQLIAKPGKTAAPPWPDLFTVVDSRQAKEAGYCNWGLLDDSLLPLGFGIAFHEGSPFKRHIDAAYVPHIFRDLGTALNTDISGEQWFVTESVKILYDTVSLQFMEMVWMLSSNALCHLIIGTRSFISCGFGL